MQNKLFVGSLPFSTTSEELEELFKPFGTVQSAQIITDRDSGRSKGFGFVEMSTDAEAQAGIEGLNGQDVGGRKLTVNVARPKQPRD